MPILTWAEIDAAPVVPYYESEWETTPNEWGGVDDRKTMGARSLIRTGDVLVCYGETRGWWPRPVWRGIQKVTGQLETHVGLCAWWKEADMLVVIEALGRSDVQVTPLSYYLPGLDDGKAHVATQRSHLFVMRPKWEYPLWYTGEVQPLPSPLAPHLALHYATRQWKLDYTEFGLAKAVWTKMFRNGVVLIPDAMWCSTLLHNALKAGGVDTPTTLAGYSTPGNIASVCETVCCLHHPER